MTFLDNFEFPDLSKYHPLKRHVRYYKVPSQSEGYNSYAQQSYCKP